jgi:LysR family cys regulon transcriptional activator
MGCRTSKESEEFKNEHRGTLSIGTTHTQARYVLPPVIQQFRSKYPRVQLHLHQGTSEQIAEMVQLSRIDFAILTGSQELFRSCVLLPSYQWNRRIIVPQAHSLATVQKPSLKQLAHFPLITYVSSFTGPSSMRSLPAPASRLTSHSRHAMPTLSRLTSDWVWEWASSPMWL